MPTTFGTPSLHNKMSYVYITYKYVARLVITCLVHVLVKKRREELGLFSFEYNLSPNLISNINHYMDQATVVEFKTKQTKE